MNQSSEDLCKDAPQPANPAQVTNALVVLEAHFERPLKEWEIIVFRAVLSAAIGAGGQAVTELRQIEEMLDAGQGDDDGPQALPDFEPDMSTLAKVEACLFLLEKRRDVIVAYGDERLFNADAHMADGEINYAHLQEQVEALDRELNVTQMREAIAIERFQAAEAERDRLREAMDLDVAISRAAITWCGEKNRETSLDDIHYFKGNWSALSGLTAYVERELGRTVRAALQKEHQP